MLHDLTRYTHTGADVARYFKRHPSSVVRWAKSPDFPQPIRISPAAVLYDLEAVKAWVAARPLCYAVGEEG